MAFQTRLPLASSEERASTAANDPVTPTHVIPGLTWNPLHIPSWIPDQCHLAGSVTSGMTCPGAWRPANAESMDGRKYCYRRYSSSLDASPPRNFRLAPKSRPGGIAHKPPPSPKPTSFRLDPESRNNHHTTPNLRHSGLDPESSPYPVMDPGSMSPRGLGDVRDDVYSSQPYNALQKRKKAVQRLPLHM